MSDSDRQSRLAAREVSREAAEATRAVAAVARAAKAAARKKAIAEVARDMEAEDTDDPRVNIGDESAAEGQRESNFPGDVSGAARPRESDGGRVRGDIPGDGSGAARPRESDGGGVRGDIPGDGSGAARPRESEGGGVRGGMPGDDSGAMRPRESEAETVRMGDLSATIHQRESEGQQRRQETNDDGQGGSTDEGPPRMGLLEFVARAKKDKQRRNRHA